MSMTLISTTLHIRSQYIKPRHQMASLLLHIHGHGKALSTLFFLLFINHSIAVETLTYKQIKANCGTTKYVDNSPFSTNLNSLLSTLKNKSSLSISINETAGEAPATVFGLYFCTGDLPQANCQACIQTAINDITVNCPSSKQAIIWYDYCELRYSDTNFFGVPDTNGFAMINIIENTTSSRPVEVVSQLVEDAPLAHPLMFKSQALISEKLYALAQCSSDLTRQGCSDCLTTILASIKSCCTTAKGWRYLAPSCWIRYEATPFLQNLNTTSIEITRSFCSSNDFPASNGLNAATQLENLLSSLTEQAPAQMGFYNTSEGEDMNKIYGLALCRGDLQNKMDDCRSCLKDASKSIVEDCPNKAQAIEWYEKCFVRYSNQNFFGMVDTNGAQALCGTGKISPTAENAVEALTMSLISDAINSPMLFRAVHNLSNYILVQCTRDLSQESCRECLQAGMSKVSNDCKQANGWRYLSGSCTLRYEEYPFFNSTSISPSPPTSASLSPVTPEKDGAAGNKASTISLAAVVTSVLAVIIL
ncbi:Gnk2-homologous domain-containing protein [Dioscorea alata]|uniref:Gnk2-homologous domain-containing protein n=1 Tax=Dioscorea alata TaxID=55571 RepID=A0ACB7WDX0_DIOAL|nr:Gnk2-homologous domain-containing protein [Dioscorea alata]